MNEQQLEQLCLSWFQDSGWEFVHGPDIAPDGDTPERTDYRQVLLPDRVLETLRRLNRQVPAVVLDEVLHSLTKPDQPSLIQNNRDFHEALRDGVPVEYDQGGEKRGDRVRLIDFTQPERNRFLIVDQFTIQGARHTRRPDIVVFINGLPVAVIELKNLADEQTDIWAAFNQLQTYKAEIPDLFVFNEALVISDGLKARVGSLTADRERFMPWRTIRNENDRPLLEFELEKVVRGFFAPELLLDYLRYFILFEDIGRHTHQEDRRLSPVPRGPGGGARDSDCSLFVGLNMKRGRSVPPMASGCNRGRARAASSGIRRARARVCLWPASLASSCSSRRCRTRRWSWSPTATTWTVNSTRPSSTPRSLLRETPQQAEDRDQLRALLAGRPSGGIIFTTIQKFMPGKRRGALPAAFRSHQHRGHR